MKRRGFLFGGATLLVAPSIVRASSLMKISVPPRDYMRELAYSFVETKEIYGANILNTAALKEMTLEHALTAVRKMCEPPHLPIQIYPTRLIVPDVPSH